VLRPRVLIYTGILVAITAAFGASILLRTPFRVDVVRDRGALARLVEDGQVENVYRLQVMNASELPQRYRIEVAGIRGAVLASKPDVEIGPTESRWVPVSVQVPPDAAAALGGGAHPIRFEITRQADAESGPLGITEKSTFVVPR
jgi:polyferredoxin